MTPECDFFAATALINAVQVLYRKWGYKAGEMVSNGGVSGGLRASQTLRQMLGHVGVMAISQVVPVPFFLTFMDENGGFVSNEKTTEGVTAMFDELAQWATALKPARAA